MIFVVVVAVVVVGGGVLAWLGVRHRAGATAREARALADGSTVRLLDERAHFVGRSSAGRSARGGGTLLLSDDALVWVMASPHRTWRLDRAQVIGAERCEEFDQQSIGRPLLRVDHLDEAGTPDASVWAVSDPEAWVSVLGPAVDPT